MVDPTAITDFNLTTDQLEERILWWVCAAGKNGVKAAECLEVLLNKIKTLYPLCSRSPFTLVVAASNDLPVLMKLSGIGCFNIKSKTFQALASSNLDLKTCSADDLEKIKGIGPKTSRCFIIHSRPNQRYAGLDTHALHFLRDKGYAAPKSTPGNKKIYKKVEQWFLAEADKAGKSVAEFDLQIWNTYRVGGKV